MTPVSHRRFWEICGLSVALHGGIFALMHSPWSKLEKPLPTIIASLKLNASSMAAAEAPSAEPRREARPDRPQPTTPPKATPEKARTLAKTPPASEKPKEMKLAAASASPATVAYAAPATPAAEPPPSVATPAPAAPVVPPTPQASRGQADALASYRQRVSEIFAGRQAYPRLAAMRGWEGEVRLRLKVARKGNLVSIALDHSSGFDVLDQNALAMVEAIAALPALPDGLDAGEIQIVVPISYKLRKTT